MKINTNRLPIRWRLTLWYVALLAVALLLFSTAIYFGMQRLLHESLDDTLDNQVELLLATIQVESGVPRIADERVIESDEDEQFVRLLDRDGQLILDTRDSEDADAGVQELRAAVRSAVRGRATIRWVAIEEDDAEQFRVLTVPIRDEGAVVGAIQAGISDEDVIESLDVVLTLLLSLGPLLLVFASAGGLWLAGRALQPVDRITRLAMEVEGNDLSRRIDLSLPNDEIGRLAKTFNAMLDRIESAFRRQRQFTADAAHELRTPLALMQSQIELTLAQPRNSENDRATLESLAVDLERLTRLSTALLSLAKSDAHGVELVPEPVDLLDLLALVAEQYAALAGAASITLVVDAQPATLTADEDQLVQVLVNLLDNALRHAPEGSTVTLGSRQDGGQVRLWVADQGSGIAPEHLPHLFERFYRVEHGRDRERGGIGLGLSISKAIVDAHGGTIEINSTPGGGTTVMVILPRQQL